MPLLDIIVPIRNEAANVESLAVRIKKALTPKSIDYRLIFVDDNSTDDSVKILNKLKKTHPILIHSKQGKRGKAYSILEGSKLSTAEFLVMIDGDCQYPPESIPEMLTEAQDKGVVVANRKKSHKSKWRALASRLNAFVFGRLIMGLNCDVQSGLKLFRREIIEQVDQNEVGEWSLDIALLITAKDMGYQIGTVEIDFADRTGGESKVNLLSTTKDIVTNALNIRLKGSKVLHVKAEDMYSMRGSGVIHKGKRYITHTTLDHQTSALHTFHSWQKFAIFGIIALLGIGALLNLFTTALIFTAVLSTIYFIDVFFNLYLVAKSLYFPPEFSFSDDELDKLDNKKLPIYSVLVPLYREAKVLPHFVENIAKMDWPKSKLDVMLLLEEDDQETQEAARELDLPSYVRVVVVPHSFPKTKPKACNYGLSHAKGEYVVIYDAEDIPDERQLKKAYLAFQKVDDKVFCLQAKLNYHNPHDNLLTRFFTAEYSLWFDLVLPGLQSLETSIPLGGTSNHFKTANLMKLQGWDPFNVTEDCDLGVRLFKDGYRTAIIDSVTLEEANSNWGNWIRQRSRWIKGYMQTYLVHMRQPLTFLRKKGVHALIFQLVVGGKIAFMLINPFLWVMTLLYFGLYRIFGPAIEALYPTAIFYMAVTSLVFGNFLCIYYYMIGCAKRGHWTLIKYIYMVPFYWLMVSVAAMKALHQLFFKPHFWEKTNHGLNLKTKLPDIAVSVEGIVDGVVPASKAVDLKKLLGLSSGATLIAASLFANFFNFLYNLYLGRSFSVEEFGIVGLLGSFMYLFGVPFDSLNRTVTHQSAYLYGKSTFPASNFWKRTRGKALVLGLAMTVIYLLLTPYLSSLFRVGTVTPLVIFAPVILFGMLSAVDAGFLNGSQMFHVIALMIVVEAIVKFVVTYVIAESNMPHYMYLSLPISMLASVSISWYAARMMARGAKNNEPTEEPFPFKFLSVATLNRLSAIAFLGLDVVLAKIILSPYDAGNYALISMIGKMVYFFGSIFAGFIIPLISKESGSNNNGTKTFRKIMLGTVLASIICYLGVGVFGFITVPLIFGQRTLNIIGYLPFFMLGVTAYTIANSIVLYHQSRKEYFVPVLGFLISIVQIILILTTKHTLGSFIYIMTGLGIAHLFSAALGHRLMYFKTFFVQNTQAFFGLFARIPNLNKRKTENLKILIFNWRDTKHIWAGGAETYVQGLAKQWVLDGHKVTIFCGNDGQSKRNEVIDGVQIVRRGGFYTVYLWAAIYYILRFRDLFDVVIESQNGVPFFTPLYSRTTVFMIVHHVHQEVFRRHLPLPLAMFAMFIEKYLNPLFYGREQFITVSESSKRDIIRHKIASEDRITVIPPGIDLSSFKKSKKTSDPSLIYLGRLKPYKNVDVLIKAMPAVLRKYPTAKLNIAGDGESMEDLVKLTKKLRLTKSVIFLGKVSEKEKTKLLAMSWIALQPSSVEGWGITVIEANACGTPVVASNVHGLRDSVINGKTGILVPERNIKEFSKAIITLISTRKDYKKMITDAKEWAQNFSWKQSVHNFSQVIANTLNNDVEQEAVPLIRNSKNNE
jgi:cellulose synthase/poly-beta-1,6-N-acetylglucosamine synthase-like glycosyltransferase/glycosyltransferase involved in cell wall biosynthesis/O-antigen/teichoic acid export membrane protein